MAYVTVINEHQHVQQIVSGHHHLTADEPVAAGGSDAGFAPRELLLASLGADTASTLRRHGAQKGWNLGKITVGLRWSQSSGPQGSGSPGNPGKEQIERRVSFAKPLSAEQKQELLKAAENSEMSLLLRPGITIQSLVVDTVST